MSDVPGDKAQRPGVKELSHLVIPEARDPHPLSPLSEPTKSTDLNLKCWVKIVFKLKERKINTKYKILCTGPANNK